jgi:hypothetical protein
MQVQQVIKLFGLCLLLAAALLTIPAFADEPNQAGLVIQSGVGEVETRCLDFVGEEISGAELLGRSGLYVILDAASSMGITVCQIEEVGCAHPAEPCFCECMGGGECAYWNYFYKDPGETEWVYSALGAALRKVQPGSVEAWVWGDGQTPPDEALSFDVICAPPALAPTATPRPATPAPATQFPATATTMPAATEAGTTEERDTEAAATEAAATEAAATEAPTASPAPPDPATVAPTATNPNLLSYWPFGLMVLGLALAGALVWLRRA